MFCTSFYLKAASARKEDSIDTVHLSNDSPDDNTHTHTHTHTQLIYVHVYIHVYVYTYMCKLYDRYTVRTRVHTYMCIHTGTHTQ